MRGVLTAGNRFGRSRLTLRLVKPLSGRGVCWILRRLLPIVILLDGG